MKSYTVKEVAEMLHVNPETVRRWIRDKKLDAVKTSNKGGNKILESELRTFLKATPAYARSAGALMALGIAAPAVMLASSAAGKAIETSDLNKAKAKVKSRDILDFIQSEIATHEVLIARKRESIRQIEKEIAAEQNRVKELQAMAEGIKATIQKGGTENG